MNRFFIFLSLSALSSIFPLFPMDNSCYAWLKEIGRKPPDTASLVQIPLNTGTSIQADDDHRPNAKNSVSNKRKSPILSGTDLAYAHSLLKRPKTETAQIESLSVLTMHSQCMICGHSSMFYKSELLKHLAGCIIKHNPSFEKRDKFSLPAYCRYDSMEDGYICSLCNEPSVYSSRSLLEQHLISLAHFRKAGYGKLIDFFEHPSQNSKVQWEDIYRTLCTILEPQRAPTYTNGPYCNLRNCVGIPRSGEGRINHFVRCILQNALHSDKGILLYCTLCNYKPFKKRLDLYSHCATEAHLEKHGKGTFQQLHNYFSSENSASPDFIESLKKNLSLCISSSRTHIPSPEPVAFSQLPQPSFLNNNHISFILDDLPLPSPPYSLPFNNYDEEPPCNV